MWFKKKEGFNKHYIFHTSAIGVVAVILAVISLIGLRSSLALGAMVLGSISIWKSFREQEYQFLFLGIASILIGLITIWNFAYQMFAYAV